LERIMADTAYPRVVSERETREWIPTCPVQIKKIRIEQAEPDGGLTLTLESLPCGDFGPVRFTADLAYQNGRRERIGGAEGLSFVTGASEPVPVPFPEAVYAQAVVRSAARKDGTLWENPEGDRGEIPPAQKVIWQTDPLYETIRQECEGVVEARYEPDEIEGAWRCACGQINLTGAKACGSCGTSRAWLTEHFDREYLEKRRAVYKAKEEKLPAVKKLRPTADRDKIKAGIIAASVLLVAVLSVLTVKVFVPSIRYNHAVRLAAEGEFDRAAGIFSSLGSFRDSKKRMSAAVYDKARSITGLDEVNMTTNAASPWFSIDENGVLSFRKDLYEKSKGGWNNFTVPDMVDGVIVRELDRNFFINCKELTVVNLSDCLEVIGEQAFYNCDLLHTVNFGKNLKTIGPRVFINCGSLETMEIPDSVESIGIRAFNNCTGLKRIVLGKGITALGDYTFALCVGLKSVTFTSPLESLGRGVFAGCTSLETFFCRFPETDWTEFEVPDDEENQIWRQPKRAFNQ
jgi:hypothetical protein